MKKIILAVALLLPFTSWAQDADLLWKARALKADENLEKYKKEMAKKDSDLVRAKIMLETAYIAILTMPDVVIKRTGSGIFYHLILNYGDDGLLDFVYSYDHSGNLLGIRIDRIPRNKVILIMNKPNSRDYVGIANIVDTAEPMLLFSIRDPFGARVLTE